MKRPRPIVPHPTDPTLALVELTRGRWAVIDAADAGSVGQFCWHLHKGTKTVYAARGVSPKHRVEGHGLVILLHRVIAERMGIPLDVEVDHENGNGLDCTRKNLRRAEHWQNAANAGVTTRNSSGVKGVSWSEARQKWVGQVKAGDRHVCRRFDTISEAAEFVRRLRAELHGEFANHGKEEQLQ